MLLKFIHVGDSKTFPCKLPFCATTAKLSLFTVALRNLNTLIDQSYTQACFDDEGIYERFLLSVYASSTEVYMEDYYALGGGEIHADKLSQV